MSPSLTGTCTRAGGTVDTTEGEPHLIDSPGVVERYWVLDVDDERAVLTGAVLPETPHAQAEQLN